MAEDNHTSASPVAGNSTSRASPNSSSAPPGYGLRRAATVGQPSNVRRRLATTNDHSPTAENQFNDYGRRGSSFSDFSITDARRDLEASADDLLNPSSATSQEVKKSPFVYVPLTLALLPALAGMLFENGSAFFTDLILLSLAAIFLHWSVTQPWDWYQSARQVRLMSDEIMTEPVFDSDTEPEPSTPGSAKTALENVPEESDNQDKPEVITKKESAGPNSKEKYRRWEIRQAAAVRELYIHEIVALAWCFVFPLIGAYLLHTIRGQLTRPSEGLVSDYNLTIFLCAAEVRPISHLIRMIQNRTLHMQQIVARNPYETRSAITPEQYQALCSRLDGLEAHSPASGEEQAQGISGSNTRPPEVPQKAVEGAVGREFRNTVQPELEAMSRAMRRYEKKLTVLACQTDNRLDHVDYRLNDAIALAAVAAKNSNAQWGLTTWLAERTVSALTFPFHAGMAVATFPVRTAATLFSRRKSSAKPSPEKNARASHRLGKMPAQVRGGPDRAAVRVSRR